jgi:hypothetical protein
MLALRKNSLLEGGAAGASVVSIASWREFSVSVSTLPIHNTYTSLSILAADPSGLEMIACLHLISRHGLIDLFCINILRRLSRLLGVYSPQPFHTPRIDI